MKIGINARTFNVEQPDGAVQTARKVARHLSERQDLSVILFGASELESDFEYVDSVIGGGFISNSPSFGVVWERTVLPYAVRKSNIDVLLCPNGNAPVSSVEKPIVMYIHDINAQKNMSSGLHGLYRKVFVPAGIENSDRIVTVSEFSKKEIISFFSLDPDVVNVVHNGVDQIFFESGRSSKLNLPERYFLYVGAMNPRKNVDNIIRAYNLIHDDIPQSLVLIGPDNKSVYKTMSTEGMHDDIITTGFVSKSELIYAYENADGFVYPSLYEGFGLPPLEAMACGTPVISSNVSSLPELLNGFAELVNPNDIEAIAVAMQDLSQGMPQGYTRDDLTSHAAKFSWDESVDSLVQILEDVVQLSNSSQNTTV